MAKDIELIKVTLRDGKMEVKLAAVNLALLSHAVRLIDLEVDDKLLNPEFSPIAVPQSVRDRIR